VEGGDPGPGGRYGGSGGTRVSTTWEYCVSDMKKEVVIPVREIPSPHHHAPTVAIMHKSPMLHQTDTISRKTDTVSLIFMHFHVGDG